MTETDEREAEIEREDTASQRKSLEKPEPQAIEEGVVDQADEIETLRRERDELYERLQRASADLHNFRRRSQTQLEDQVRFRMENLFQDLIAVLDGMDAAFTGGGAAQTQDSSSSQAILEGFEHLHRRLASCLESNGLKRIETTGKPFDPRLHEVLFAEESDQVPPDTVMQELRAGYLLRERVLRPAQVKISKAPAEESPGLESPEANVESE